MNTKREQFPADNPNPVLSVAKDGTVIYSNKAGEPLLHEWGVAVGEKLPSSIGNIAKNVISRNSPEKMEVKVGKKVYWVAFHALPEEECVNIYGFDRSDWREFEEKLLGSKAQEGVNLELADIIDIPAIQSLMDDLYELTHITIALVDLKGNIPIIAGRQEICSRFHRVHPETCKHCVESDTKLSLGVAPGEFKMYKCKNNMWDVATPLIVGGQHIGNIFSGHFFFEDEPLEYELFRSQARQYGFNEEEYITALEKVPRLSREAVNKNMSVFMKLANMISQLSHSNFKLAQSLADLDTLLEALQESERCERARSDELSAVLDAVPVAVYISHDPQVLQITGNHLSYEWLQLPVGTNFSKSAPEGERPETFKLFKDGVEMLPADMPSQMAARGREINDCELDLVSADGRIRHVLGNSRPLRDEQGNLSGSISAFIDITERKKTEEALKLSNLYNRSLIEASLDPLVTIGYDGKITDVNGATEQVTGYSRRELIGTDFSDYFTEPEKARRGYQQVFTDGKVWDYPLEIKHKDGHITPVLYNASVYRDENGKVTGVFAAARDITERKEAEAALQKSEEHYRMLFTNMTEGFALTKILYDKDGRPYDYRYHEINPAYELSLGVKREDLIGKTMLEVFPNTTPITIKKFGETALTGQSAQFEVFSKVANSYIDIYAFIPEKGKLAWILRDITKRKEAENKLKETLDNLEKLVEERTAELKKAYELLKESENGLAEAQKMVHIGNWDWNLVTGEVQWSDEMYRIYGLNLQESGATYEELLNYMHPDNRDYFDDAVKKGLKGEFKSIDYRIILASGEERTVHTHPKIIFDENNRPIRIKGTTQDITERKKAEEKIRILADAVESSNDAIVTESFDGIITSWNQGAEHIYGYSAEEILGKSVSILEPDNLKGEIKKLIEKVKQREKVQHYRTLRLKKDGTIINVSVTYSPVFDASGQLMAISVIGRDITAQINAEKLLAKAEEARKKEIHHRIKNNLQVISSLLDLQAEKFRSRERVEDMEVLNAFRESQDRVISIALIHEELHEGRGNDILNFSPYLEKLVESLFQTYKVGNANTSLNIDLEENIFFDTDIAVPLGIIINELVSNSLKYAFSGRDNGKIQIKLHREESAELVNRGQESTKKDHKSTNFILTVLDDGIGIPEKFNLENSSSLGLQLVEILVDQLGGEIELKRDSGTEVKIKFTVTEQK